MFEVEFDKFVERQKKTANLQRLEQLNKDLTGTVVMFKNVLWPVFRSFDGFILEHEIQTSSGVKLYIDAFHEYLKFGFESEGYVPHAQNITRDRFNFERMRVRTMSAYG